MTWEDIKFALGAVFLFSLLWLAVWQHVIVDDVLLKWARDSGFQIIKSSRDWLNPGPFPFFDRKPKFIYQITVKDGRGYTRAGWVRFGSRFLGVYSKQAQVIWDHDWQPPQDGPPSA